MCASMTRRTVQKMTLFGSTMSGWSDTKPMSRKSFYIIELCFREPKPIAAQDWMSQQCPMYNPT